METPHENLLRTPLAGLDSYPKCSSSKDMDDPPADTVA